MKDKRKIVIIGAGPAGLTAGYEAVKSKELKPIILEADPIYVGGISRTVNYKGYRFDIGGHRFFSKSQEIEDLWTIILGSEMLVRPRLSRIYYNKKFFDYPLKAGNAIKNLGLLEALLVLISYVKSKLVPYKNPKNLEEWVSNNFGTRLFKIFFKTYTEKVWGRDCKNISADWAAQRIKGLSLFSAIIESIKSEFKIGKSKKEVKIKTLIDEFRYPRKGPGQLWERVTDIINKKGGEVILDAKVVNVTASKNKISSVTYKNSKGKISKLAGDFFISTMPIRELINSINPIPEKNVVKAANSLEYRDFITVALIIDVKDIFPDNWIYIHDSSVKLGRIQNYKNWSDFMVSDKNSTCLGLEYFCNENDRLWKLSDSDLIELGKKELVITGLVKDISLIRDGKVVRMPKAYPVYDDFYKENVRIVNEYVKSLGNLYLVGRNGMHKYNNQDHSMMTAIIAVKNILGTSNVDPWDVNTDASYHEQK